MTSVDIRRIESYNHDMCTARALSIAEINDMLNFIDDMYLGVDPAARAVLISKLKEPLITKLQMARIDPTLKYKLKAEIQRIYKPVEPGKSVGIITAQSVGEIQTQMNLNTFHRAGYRDPSAAHGSRLQELTCTSKSETQTSPTCTIYPLSGIAERHEMLRSLTHMTFSAYVKHTRITSVKRDTSIAWEAAYHTYYHVQRRGEWRQVYTLDIELLYRFRMDLEYIVNTLRQEMAELELECTFAFSPLYIGEICVYSHNLQLLKTKIHKQLARTRINGIPGIKQAYFMPNKGNPDDLFIETEGTNLQEILYLPFVDTYTVVSTDIWEIYNIFGIEAVRQFLVEEFTGIMPAVHFSHIQLLADRMTVAGKLKSFTRYTRRDEHKASILSKITFEETMKGFTTAAFKEQVDNTLGCSSSVICGKLPKSGTGLNELLFDA